MTLFLILETIGISEIVLAVVLVSVLIVMSMVGFSLISTWRSEK